MGSNDRCTKTTTEESPAVTGNRELTNRWKGGVPEAHIRDGFFVWNEDGELVKVWFDTILWIEAESHKCCIYLKDTQPPLRITTAMNIGEIEHVLSQARPSHFVRIGRSTIVCIEEVYKVDGNTLFVRGWPTRLYVTGKYRHYTFACLGLHRGKLECKASGKGHSITNYDNRTNKQ